MEVTTNTALIWDGVWHFWDRQTKTEIPVTLPERWTVCPECDGEGKIGNPAFNGMSLSELDADDRDDFMDGYTSGRYDVTCGHCKGRTTVKGYDLSVLTPEQRDQYQRDLDQHWSDFALQQAERRAEGYEC